MAENALPQPNEGEKEEMDIAQTTDAHVHREHSGQWLFGRHGVS